MVQGRRVAPPELGERLCSDISGTLTRISHELSATAPDPSASAGALYSQWRQPACGHERLIRREERAVALTASPTLRDENP